MTWTSWPEGTDLEEVGVFQQIAVEEQHSCPSQLQEAKAKPCLFQIISFTTSRKKVAYEVRQDTQTLTSTLKNKQQGEGISCLAFPEIWIAVNRPCWTTEPWSPYTQYLCFGRRKKETCDFCLQRGAHFCHSLASYRLHHNLCALAQSF